MILLIILLFLPLFQTAALDRDYDAADFKLAAGTNFVFPFGMSHFFKDINPGVQFRFKPIPMLGFLLDYLYVGREYYYFNHDSNYWFGPVPWSAVPERSERRDWLFYHDRHFICLSAAFYLPINKVEFFISQGISLVWLSLSNAGDYYPDFQQSFDNLGQGRKVFLGHLLRLGGEYHFLKHFSAGAALGLESIRIADFFRSEGGTFGSYLQERGSFGLYVLFNL